MSLIARMGAMLLVLFVAVPIVSSTAIGSKNCTKKEFWSKDNDDCLPIGGPLTPPPPPPKGKACPPSTHYWGKKQGCCVPLNPSPEQGPPPQCRGAWVWKSTVRSCVPVPTPPKPSPPKPSNYHHNGHDNNGHAGYRQKRSALLKSRSAPLCPTGLDACPISGAKAGDYECLDTATELESCGGCTSLGSGQNCTAIPGAWNVGCEEGYCTVYTCAGGFKRSKDGKSCIQL